jgi:photosystem II stability/assembly factor-like uncharacterized protein
MKRMFRATMAFVLITVSAALLRPCTPERIEKSGLYRVLKKTGWIDEGWTFPVSLPFNSWNSDCKPSMTADGKYLYFLSGAQNGPPLSPNHMGNGFNMYVARWNGASWDSVTNLGENVNPASYSCISADNRSIYLTRNDGICVSQRSPSGWSKAKKLPYPINDTDPNVTDRTPYITPDGNELYFASNRPGGHGSYDLYVVRWNGSAWDSLTNLGDRVNTRFSETHPALSPDGQKLYFSNFNSTGGRDAFGDTDIYVSLRDGAGWSEPQLLGPPINTDMPCCSAFPTADGRLLLGSEVSEGGKGEEDIWAAYPGGTEIVRETITMPGEGGWKNTGELKDAWYVHCLIESQDGTLYAGTAPEGAVYKSPDGGQNWTRTGSLDGATRVYSLFEASNGALYAGTYPNGDVFKSSDKGTTWDNTADLINAKAVRAIVELPNSRLFAGTSPDSSDIGRLFYTTNGGSSWKLVRPPHPIFRGGIFTLFYNDGVLFAGGRVSGDNIILSSNSGNTWNVANLPFDDDDITLANIYFFFKTSDGAIWTGGWAHGPQGIVASSPDNGKTWNAASEIRFRNVEMARIFSFVQKSDGSLLAGGHPGPDTVLACTSDKGATWGTGGTLPGAGEVLCLLKARDGSIYAGTTPNGDVFKLSSETSVKETPRFPRDFELSQNYPNPFNGNTYLHYRLEAPGRVELCIFNVRGERVRTLAEGARHRGDSILIWDGSGDDGASLPSGVYSCRLRVVFDDGAERLAHRKMLMLR